MSVDVRQIEGLADLADDRVREVVIELCGAILQGFPGAEFRVFPNPGHRGAIVEAYVDSDEMEPVFELVRERRLDLLLEEDISIRIWPLNRARRLANGPA